jgi:hypothetical protein
MGIALRIDKKLYGLGMPQMKRISGVEFESEDVLICSAGFEDRVLGILNSSIESGGRGFRLIVITYLPYVVQNRIEEIRRKSEDCNLSVRNVIYDRENPSGIGDHVLAEVEDAKGRVFVDVSGMSRLLIVQILTALNRRTSEFEKTSVLYSMANDYPPTEEEADAAIKRMSDEPLFSAVFLSSGVFEVCIVPELSSFALEGQPIRLISFPSFNANQIAALRSEIQASFFTFIHGVPPLPENVWRREKIGILNRTGEISNREDLEASTLDYRETMKLLLEAYDKYGVSEKLVIAPTGSKMQTVAVGIVRAFLEDLQIVYPTPRLFPQPHKYTSGVREMFRLDLDDYRGIRSKES